MNNEDLKLHISAIQTERDWLTILLSEYVKDAISIKEEWAV